MATYAQPITESTGYSVLDSQYCDVCGCLAVFGDLRGGTDALLVTKADIGKWEESRFDEDLEEYEGVGGRGLGLKGLLALLCCLFVF